MKKSYEKPFVIKESFQLDAAIAGSCADQNGITLNHSTTTCPHESGFYAGDLCRTPVQAPGGDGNDGLCYHGPFGSLIFLQS